jgi:hypothetical protein
MRVAERTEAAHEACLFRTKAPRLLAVERVRRLMMARLNLDSLPSRSPAHSVVTSPHGAQTYVELQKEQERCRQLEIEWGPAATRAEHGRCTRASKNREAASSDACAAASRVQVVAPEPAQ